MLLDHYVSAMPCWKGRVDSDSDYDAFRWHQRVQPLDLNDGGAPFDGEMCIRDSSTALRSSGTPPGTARFPRWTPRR